MAYVIKSRQTNAIVGRTSDVEEALLFDAQWRVDADSFESVIELAEAKVKASPDYNTLPEKDERWVRYMTKAGKMMVCQVVRLTHPDDEGYPQLAELVNPARPDGSFMVSTSAIKVIDLAGMTPELANALLQGPELCDQDGVGHTPKLRHGLRRDK